jgi:hypothetical protein
LPRAHKLKGDQLSDKWSYPLGMNAWLYLVIVSRQVGWMSAVWYGNEDNGKITHTLVRENAERR